MSAVQILQALVFWIAIATAMPVFRIGAIYPNTGFVNTLVGAQNKRGYQLWEETVNAGLPDSGGFLIGGVRHRVEVIYKGTNSTEEAAAKATEELILAHNPNYLFLPFTTELGVAAAMVAHNYSINSNMLITSAVNAFICDDDLLYPCQVNYGRRFPWSVGQSFPVDKFVSDVINLLKTNGGQTAALFYENIAITDEIARGARRTTEFADMRMVEELRLVNVTSEPEKERRELIDFINKLKVSKPDIVIGASFTSCITFMKLAKELNFNAKAFIMPHPCYARIPSALREDGRYIFGSGAVWDPRLRGSQFDENARDKAPYHHFVSNGTETSARIFQKRFQARFPDAKFDISYAMIAYMAGYVVQHGVETAGSTDPKAIQAAINSLSIKGAGGPVQFDIYGQNVGIIPVSLQYDENVKPQILIPLVSITNPIIYPVPTWNQRLTTYGWYSYNSEYVIMALTVAVILLTIALIGWFLVYRNHQIVRASQPIFVVIAMIGSIIMYCTIFFWSLHASNLHCSLVRWFPSIGFALLYGALFARVYRIAQIFLVKTLEIFKVTDMMIVPIVAIIVGVNVVLIATWTIVSPGKATLVMGDKYDFSDDYFTCQFSKTDTVFFIIGIVLNMVVLVFGMYYVVRIWHLKSVLYNESKAIGFAVYTLAFFIVLVIILGFVAGGEDREVSYVIRSLCFIFGPLVSILAILIPKMIYMQQTIKSTAGSDNTKFNISGKSSNAKSMEITETPKDLYTKIADLEAEVKRLKAIVKSHQVLVDTEE